MSWKEKIEADLDQLEACGGPEISVEGGDGSYSQHVQYRDGVLTVGCCGELLDALDAKTPNVRRT